MRVLLIAVNSRYIHSSPVLSALRRAAEEAGCRSGMAAAADEVTLATLETTISRPQSELLEEICCLQPEVVAFSTYIWNISWLKPLLYDLRLLLPEALLLLGGPEATARSQDYLAELPVDGICLGEGEGPFAALLRTLSGLAQLRAHRLSPHDAALRALDGWLWREHARDYSPAQLPDLAALPFLYSDQELAELGREKRVIYYESSRGCPFRCSFCASAKTPLRERPLRLVLAELPRLAATATQIKFVDRTFNADPARAVAITERVLALYRPGLSWHFEISPFALPAELVTLWQQAPRNYLRLEMGVQTLHAQSLAAVGRRGDWLAAEPTVRSLIAAGRVHLHLDLIAGLPLDTPAQFAASFHRLHQLNAHYLQLGFLKVLPDSLLSTDAANYGLVYSSQPPYQVLATPQMPAEYLFALHRTEHIFNALYNKAAFRSELLAKAERYPGGALAMYARAAALAAAAPARLDKSELVAAL